MNSGLQNKVNYDLQMEKTIESFKGQKKSLLLHCCCAPCSSAVLERLCDIFDITVYFYNPNILPKEEFEYRANEEKRLIESMSCLRGEIKLVIAEYDSKEFFMATKGMENEPEGGKRCRNCFKLRLEKAAEYAAENKFDYFTTTLSISPHKNSTVLNEVGEEASQKFNVKYLVSDFKKKDGYKRSILLSQEYELYRQNYCGCVFSVKSENNN